MTVYTGAAAIPDQINWSGDLPVLEARDQLIAAISKHQVIIVAGETGSGKTTQLPKICLAAGRGRTGLIGHTQPRRIAARAVATRIAEELVTTVGQGVGFKVRFSDHTSPGTYLKLMTDGVLLAELAHDRYLNAYDTLIIDEAHERSLNIDFLLGYLRQLLPRRKDLKVIITSATIDVARFSQHFHDAPVFVVEGRSFPVEVRNRPLLLDRSSEDDALYDDIEEAIPRAVVAAVEECLQHERDQGQPGRGDILVFSSSEREIRTLAETLRRYGPPHTEILPLYSRLSIQEQQKVFSRGAGRRIIIATNVAETSLTVPNIHYVIDPGFARISRYSYRSKVQRLPIEAVSQASANQRAGRCGRIAPGVCIRLYSEVDYQSRALFTDPEIQRTNLAAVILQMQLLGLGDVGSFPFLDSPDSRLINDGFRLLEELGAVDSQRRMTKIGRQLARMPLDPRLARMVVAAAPLGALHEVLIIVAALSVQDPRERPHDKQQAADERHAQFRDADSDFVFFVNLWNQLSAQKETMTERQRREFARKHFLSWMRLREWRETYRQLQQLCESLKLPINREPAPYEAIHRALLTGLLSQVAQKGEEREYQAPRNQKAVIFPGSVLAKKGPPWLMAAELMETGRVYLRLVARIEPAWVEHLAQHLIKRSYSEPHWSRRQGRVMAYEQTSLYGLILQTKRRVNYEVIDREASREIFIRDALVAGEVDLKAAFFKHNQALIAEVEHWEDKTRRRDLLVDEQALFAFYDSRIPPDVASLKSFEDWRHRAEKDNPSILLLEEQDVLAREADSRALHDYPDSLRLAGHDLALSYVFEPGSEFDGVTVQVPLGLLDDISEQRLAWLVPGLIAGKVEALLRGLPKPLRRQLVPLPDTVEHILDGIRFAEGDLLQVLSQAVSRRGVRVAQHDWQEATLDDHFRMNICVLGAKKEVLAQGRDLQQLRAALTRQGRSANAIDGHAKKQWERIGIKAWDFPDLPDCISTESGGLPGKAYPALHKTPQGLALTLFQGQKQAQAAHAEGVAELICHVLNQDFKSLRKQLRNDKTLLLHANAWITIDQLDADVSYALVAQYLAGQKSLVYTQQEFDRVVADLRPQLMTRAQQIITLVAQIYQLAHQVLMQLKPLNSPVYVMANADMQMQLQSLKLGAFLREVEYLRWQHYPRYLKAMLQRLEKLSSNVLKDDKGSAELQQRWLAWQQLVEHWQNQGKDLQPLLDYRWLLEEYRVSIFAQPMKTAVPVSNVRLDKVWAQLTS